jgi:hypothetical protein
VGKNDGVAREGTPKAVVRAMSEQLLTVRLPIQRKHYRNHDSRLTITAQPLGLPVQRNHYSPDCSGFYHYSGLASAGGAVVVSMDCNGSGRLYWQQKTVVVSFTTTVWTVLVYTTTAALPLQAVTTTASWP